MAGSGSKGDVDKKAMKLRKIVKNTPMKKKSTSSSSSSKKKNKSQDKITKDLLPQCFPHLATLHQQLNEDPSWKSLKAKPPRDKDTPSCRNCGDPGAPMCLLCSISEGNPTRGLPSFISMYQCPDCLAYSESTSQGWFQAGEESKELLAFLLHKLKRSMTRVKVELINASLLPREPNSRNLKLSLALLWKGPQQELFHSLSILVKGRTCMPCIVKEPVAGTWSTVVQLRQHGCHNLSRLKLERFLLRFPNLAAHRVKTVDQGTDFFFVQEKEAIKFCKDLSRLYPIKTDEIHKINGNESCILVWVCPIWQHDLVLLPPDVSANLGSLGPLVICTELSNKITLLDPLSLRKCALSAEDYWKAPFEPLITSRDLIEFVVLNVEIVLKGMKDSLADIKVARVSDFGNNDMTFLVRSHLGEALKPGDYALGYDLCRTNINEMELDKCQDFQQLDVVLIKNKNEHLLKQAKIKKDQETGREAAKNCEVMFNMSLDSGHVMK